MSMKNLFKSLKFPKSGKKEAEESVEEEQREQAAAAEEPPVEQPDAPEGADEQEERVVRHTISAEETFTLAKDVYDLRSFFKTVYSNRAVIARRLNIFSLICSLIFTMFYTAYTVWVVVAGRLSVGVEVTLYCLLGVYVAFVIVLVVTTVFAGKVTTKTVKKYNKALKIFRFCIRVVSIAMAIVAIVIGAASESPAAIALQTVFVVISIILIIIQAVPLIFGGFSNLVRWALAPAKGRARFSVVLLEWYELVRSGSATSPAASKISPKYLDDINRCIDGFLIPRLGKNYITSITAQDIYDAAEAVPEDLKDITEGIFKRVFTYAEECGYVNHNPTKAMQLEDNLVEPEKKPRRTIKTRLMDLGKRIGKSIVKSYLDDEQKKG